LLRLIGDVSLFRVRGRATSSVVQGHHAVQRHGRCRSRRMGGRKTERDGTETGPQRSHDDAGRLHCRLDVWIKLERRTRKTAFNRDLTVYQTTAGDSDVVSMSGSSWKEEQERRRSVETSGPARGPQATLMSCPCLDLAERKNNEDRIQSRTQGLPDDRRRL